MENRPQFSFDGQEVEQGDLQAAYDAAAWADDHVFAELFRLAPLQGAGSSSRGIMPWGYAGQAISALPLGLVTPNGATGSVLVAPFRAFIGSRTLASADAQKNYRELRSALSVAAGSTSLTAVETFGANSSGNPRWDLIVAVVTIDAAVPGATQTRFVKDTTNDSAVPTTVVTQVATTVTLQVVAGTPAASPAPPAVPADAAPVFYIPIAAVRIPNGFTAASTIAKSDIAIIAPLVGIDAKAAGGTSWEPADSNFTTLLTNLNIGFGIWGSSGGRVGAFMPSTARGGFMRELAVDLVTGGGAHVQPVNNSVIDSGHDYRRRRFLAMVHFDPNSAWFPFHPSAVGFINGGQPIPTSNGNFVRSQSHFADTLGLNTWGSAYSTLAMMTPAGWSAMAPATEVDIVVSQTTGTLGISYSGAVNGIIHCFIWASGQVDNDR